MCVCVCVCVRERERKRDRAKESKRERDREICLGEAKEDYVLQSCPFTFYPVERKKKVAEISFIENLLIVAG